MMKKNKFLVIVLLCAFVQGTVLTSCSEQKRLTKKEYFTLWNSCEALTTLKAYVEDVTTPTSANFIPKEDRIATFDMDGTFIGELYPTYFEYNLLEYRALMTRLTPKPPQRMSVRRRKPSATSSAMAPLCPTIST